MGLLKKDGDITRMAIVTIAIFLAMAMLRPNLFLTVNNFTSMGYQIPELGLYSLAMMVVMITGGRDLSIVGIGNLACILSAYILRYAFLKQFYRRKAVAVYLFGYRSGCGHRTRLRAHQRTHHCQLWHLSNVGYHGDVFHLYRYRNHHQ